MCKLREESIQFISMEKVKGYCARKTFCTANVVGVEIANV